MAEFDLTPEDGRPDPSTLPPPPPPARPPGPVVPEPDPLAEMPEPLTESEVGRWLDRLGRLLALGLRGPDGARDAYRFTTEEVDDLTPPVARQINKRGAWLRLVLTQADLLEIGFLLIEWWQRAREDVAAALASTEEAQAATRVDLEPGDPARGPATFGLNPNPEEM